MSVILGWIADAPEVPLDHRHGCLTEVDVLHQFCGIQRFTRDALTRRQGCCAVERRSVSEQAAASRHRRIGVEVTRGYARLIVRTTLALFPPMSPQDSRNCPGACAVKPLLPIYGSSQYMC